MRRVYIHLGWYNEYLRTCTTTLLYVHYSALLQGLVLHTDDSTYDTARQRIG